MKIQYKSGYESIQDTLGQIVRLKNNLGKIPQTEEVAIDFEYVDPLSIVSLAREFKTRNVFFSGKSKSYLEIVGFPKGVEIVPTDFGQSYLPLVCIPSSATSDLLDLRISEYVKFVSSRLGIAAKDSLFNALMYLFSELFDNIEQHSSFDKSWMICQHWKKKGEISICLADDGIGFHQNYVNNGVILESDEEAIGNAVEGRSTKEGKGRGYGLRTSISVVTEGLGGEAMLISGNSCYYNNLGQAIFVDLPVAFGGVLFVVNFKIPDSNFDLMRYVEG